MRPESVSRQHKDTPYDTGNPPVEHYVVRKEVRNDEFDYSYGQPQHEKDDGTEHHLWGEACLFGSSVNRAQAEEDWGQIMSIESEAAAYHR